MRTTRRILMAGILTVLCLIQAIHAGFVPNVISYEGTVLDEFGQPATGSATLRFSLVTTNGVALWKEQHDNVPLSTSSGAFQVLLGKSKPLPETYGTLRLVLELNTSGSSWKELTPPQILPSVVYALQAAEALQAPGNLTVKQDLTVSGAFTSAGTLSAVQVTSASIDAGSIDTKQLVVSELKSTPGNPLHINSDLMLSSGIVVKGTVAMMKVIDLLSTPFPASLSGRVYLLAATRHAYITDSVRVHYAAGGAPSIYRSNLPKGSFFLPLDLQPGDTIEFFNSETYEILPQANYYTFFSTVQLITIGQ